MYVKRKKHRVKNSVRSHARTAGELCLLLRRRNSPKSICCNSNILTRSTFATHQEGKLRKSYYSKTTVYMWYQNYVYLLLLYLLNLWEEKKYIIMNHLYTYPTAASPINMHTHFGKIYTFRFSSWVQHEQMLLSSSNIRRGKRRYKL